jgi:hypothetical protein
MQQPSAPDEYVEVQGIDLLRDRPSAPELFYLCKRCGSVVSSAPTSNLGCTCGDVFVDLDAGRLVLRNAKRVSLLRRVEK